MTKQLLNPPSIFHEGHPVYKPSQDPKYPGIRGPIYGIVHAVVRSHIGLKYVDWATIVTCDGTQQLLSSDAIHTGGFTIGLVAHPQATHLVGAPAPTGLPRSPTAPARIVYAAPTPGTEVNPFHIGQRIFRRVGNLTPIYMGDVSKVGISATVGIFWASTHLNNTVSSFSLGKGDVRIGARPHA